MLKARMCVTLGKEYINFRNHALVTKNVEHYLLLAGVSFDPTLFPSLGTSGGKAGGLSVEVVVG